MNKKQKRWMRRILVGAAIYVAAYAITLLVPLEQLLGPQGSLYAELALFAVPYLIVGYDVLSKAGRNIVHGQVFDENFLMAIATLGAFALAAFPEAEQHFAEAAAVMLFYQVGELFQSYAVGRSRQSIADLMDIAPDFANKEVDGELEEVDPFEVEVGDVIVVKPGERIPLDGTIIQGTTSLDTAALTGESVPRKAQVGDDVVSGCIVMDGLVRIRTTKLFEESTVSRILELVENASEKKARTENFITRFARYYTPVVVVLALLLAVLPPLVTGGAWSDWIQRGLIFLVVSCPCALVISVPLSFFGGIGGASRSGILVKGGNYLESLARVETVVFDKTGTLTTGSFGVTEVLCQEGVATSDLLKWAAQAEAFSNHPIAQSLRAAYAELPDADPIDPAVVMDVREESGHGLAASCEGHDVLVGNAKLMAAHGIAYEPCKAAGTAVYVARDGEFAGSIVIADKVKINAKTAIADLKKAGVKQTVMLTGDREDVAMSVASALGLDKYRAELLPQHKVDELEALLKQSHENASDGKTNVAFVGDGINDAPVLTRADVGIAMGALGSDAAIEAADVVLMDDDPSSIARAIIIARKTMGIVWQNIVFALGVKFLVLALAAFGMATMWLAVFADVGVAVLAILNAMRCMKLGAN